MSFSPTHPATQQSNGVLQSGAQTWRYQICASLVMVVPTLVWTSVQEALNAQASREWHPGHVVALSFDGLDPTTGSAYRPWSLPCPNIS